MQSIPAAETLLDAACQATGLADLGEDAWRPALERLIDALRN